MANKPRSETESTPRNFPQTTPRFAQQGHDFTLQAIIEMQRSLGDLSAKVDRLITDVKGQGEKIDGVRIKFAWFTGAAAVLSFLFATGLALVKFWPTSGGK
jgi:hypothetical protein